MEVLRYAPIKCIYHSYQCNICIFLGWSHDKREMVTLLVKLSLKTRPMVSISKVES